MHEILGSGVQINVLLNRGLFGESPRFAAEAIEDPVAQAHAVVAEFHDHGEPNVEDHGADYCVTHACEPTLVEI